MIGLSDGAGEESVPEPVITKMTNLLFYGDSDLALWSLPNSSIAISVYFARLPVEPLAEGYPPLR